MFAPGCSVMFLLFHLFSSVNTFPVPRYTPAPPLPLQIQPATPTILPSLLFSSLSVPTLNPPFSNTFEQPAKRSMCPLMLSPSRLVVRFEEPVAVNCSKTVKAFSILGWEVSPPKPNITMEDFLVWSVAKITEWNMKPVCFLLAEQGGYCQLALSLVVYKPPDRVLLSLVNHTGPMLEGHQYTLQCTVQGVAPVENLTVTFYREQTILGQLWSNNSTKEPVTEIFTLDISPSKEDDTLQYWCEAKLELGPEGPWHPPVVRSQNITASVYFGPELASPRKLQMKEGERLSCEVRGNPQPAVTWFRDGKEVTPPAHLSRWHAGKYNIWAKGPLEQRNFTVEVEVLPGSGAANYCNRHFLLAVLLIQAILWL